MNAQPWNVSVTLSAPLFVPLFVPVFVLVSMLGWGAAAAWGQPGPRMVERIGEYRWSMDCHVRRMAWLDGQRLAVAGCCAGADGPTLAVIDAATGRRLMGTNLCEWRAYRLLARDGQLWVLAEGQHLRRVNARTGDVQARRDLQQPLQQTGEYAINPLGFLGGDVVCAVADQLRRFERDSLAPRGRIAPEIGEIHALADLADGRLLALGMGGTNHGATIALIAPGAPVVRHDLFRAPDAYRNLRWDDDPFAIDRVRDGRQRYVCAVERTLFVAAHADATPRAWLSLDTRVQSMAFTPDGAALVVGDERGGLRCLDLSSGRCRWRAPARTDGSRTYDIGFAPDGRLLTAGHVIERRDPAGALLGDPRLRMGPQAVVWRRGRPLALAEGRVVDWDYGRLRRWRRPASHLRSMALGRDDVVFVGDADGRLWRCLDADTAPRRVAVADFINCELLGGGDHVVAYDRSDIGAALHEADSPQGGVATLDQRSGRLRYVTRAPVLRISPRGYHAVVALSGADAAPRQALLDLRSGRAVRYLPRELHVLHVTDEGVVRATRDGLDGELLLRADRSLRVPRSETALIGCSPDGRFELRLESNEDYRNGRLVLRDTRRRTSWPLDAHRGAIMSHAWSGDGRLLLGSRDRTLTIWRLPR